MTQQVCTLVKKMLIKHTIIRCWMSLCKHHFTSMYISEMHLSVNIPHLDSSAAECWSRYSLNGPPSTLPLPAAAAHGERISPPYWSPDPPTWRYVICVSFLSRISDCVKSSINEIGNQVHDGHPNVWRACLVLGLELFTLHIVSEN